jgi:hypothetical protein
VITRNRRATLSFVRRHQSLTPTTARIGVPSIPHSSLSCIQRPTARPMRSVAVVKPAQDYFLGRNTPGATSPESERNLVAADGLWRRQCSASAPRFLMHPSSTRRGEMEIPACTLRDMRLSVYLRNTGFG